MLLDDVAADFPELTIVMAHPAVPWVDAQIAIASHKSNVYIDLSRAGRRSTSRRNWCAPPAVSCGRRCCSAPTTRTSRWTAGAATSRALDIDPAVVPLIYKDNALRVLGVTS